MSELDRVKKIDHPHSDCADLDRNLLDPSCALSYDQQRRFYYMQPIDEFAPFSVLLFCPWCAHEFEPDLTNQFWNELSKYSISSLEDYDKYRNDIPQELLSDQWWKNLGL